MEIQSIHRRFCPIHPSNRNYRELFIGECACGAIPRTTVKTMNPCPSCGSHTAMCAPHCELANPKASTMDTPKELQRYTCHKQVNAAKIRGIDFSFGGDALIALGGVRPLPVDNYRAKFKGSAEDLGYYVVYDDGYESWSPSKAFEEGYKLTPLPTPVGITP